MKIEDVIKTKGSTAVETIAPDASVAELVRVLTEKNIGAVVVSTDGRHIAVSPICDSTGRITPGCSVIGIWSA